MSELVFTRVQPRQKQVLFRWPLRTGSVSIGHDPESDFTLPANGGPAIQLTVAETRDGQFLLTGHGGTAVPVNGTAIQSKVLANGDTIQLGDLTVVFFAAPQPRHRTLRRGEPAEPHNARTYLEYKHRRMVVTDVGVRVGADPESDLWLEDAHVSQQHAVVMRRKGVTTVQDLESTNGTRINDVRITKAEAPPTAVLDFGGVKVRLLTLQDPEAQDGVAVRRVGGLLYADPAMEEVARRIRLVAGGDGPVWIGGESGVGKELVARAIHDLGPRSAMPFVALNCAALPSNLVESELFGHERGAFTHAERPRMGAFEEAGEGTLFLDEIGDLALDVQAKLLRVLENMTVRRVGGTGEKKVQCRVLVATHQKLMSLVARGGFRMDLFQRIAALPIFVPPLCERPKDIPLLARHLLNESQGAVTLTPAALEKLQGHRWPGNVRELRNVLMRAATFSEASTLDAKDIAFLSHEPALARQLYTPGMTLADIELQVMQEALREHGSLHAASDKLGISRNKLKRRLEGRGASSGEDD